MGKKRTKRKIRMMEKTIDSMDLRNQVMYNRLVRIETYLGLSPIAGVTKSTFSVNESDPIPADASAEEVIDAVVIPTNNQLHSLLGVANEGLTYGAIRRLANDDRIEVASYAASVHASASDHNEVIVPPKPALLEICSACGHRIAEHYGKSGRCEYLLGDGEVCPCGDGKYWDKLAEGASDIAVFGLDHERAEGEAHVH